jgi:dinuclear metal center YbgI/SA1388 family protein
MTLQDLLTRLAELAPLDLAAEWDNVGLLLGDPAAEIERVMTCLTVTPNVVAEAIEARAAVVISHHPLFFRGVKRVTSGTTEGRMVLDLARGGIAVYSAHTAFDNAPGGINELLAQRLQLAEVRPLKPRQRSECKIVVFTPDKDLAKVSDAMFAAGAGWIGQYKECSFRWAGTGTFFATESTNPTVGQKGRREEVNEWVVEVVCPAARVDDVVAAMRRAHSYEELAFDVYPLRPMPDRVGVGRLGRLSKATSLGDFARAVKDSLGAASVQIVGEQARPVERVAIVCGAGGDLVHEVLAVKADVFLTGEMRFHDCLAAEAQGLAVVLPGHYATERFGMEHLAAKLQTEFPGLKVWASRNERDPMVPLG